MLSHYNENQNYLVTGRSFNEIRDGIAKERHSGDNIQNRPDGDVWVVGTTQSAYTAVGLGTLASTDEEGNVLYGGFVFNAGTTKVGEPFGILMEDGAAGYATRTCAHGICRARVNITDSTHTYADVSGTTLSSSTAGPCRILWKNGNSGVVNALVDLMGVSTGGGGAGGTITIAETADDVIMASGMTISATTRSGYTPIYEASYAVVSDCDTETGKTFLRQLCTSTGNGIALWQSGRLITMDATTNSVLGFINGSFSWVPVETTSDADEIGDGTL